MNRIIALVAVAAAVALFTINGAAAGIAQKIVTVSIPNDYLSTEAYKVEFSIPEGSRAFNFTLWGTEKTWGIVDITGGAYKEVYSSTGGAGNGDVPLNDAESSERIVSPPPEGEPTDSLSRLMLFPGSYIVWMEGKPGASMTIQYNLQTAR